LYICYNRSKISGIDFALSLAMPVAYCVPSIANMNVVFPKGSLH
jgi:hypothetical protein